MTLSDLTEDEIKVVEEYRKKKRDEEYQRKVAKIFAECDHVWEYDFYMSHKYVTYYTCKKCGGRKGEDNFKDVRRTPNVF